MRGISSCKASGTGFLRGWLKRQRIEDEDEDEGAANVRLRWPSDPDSHDC